MNKHRDHTNRAEQYLKPGTFDVCSILCGKAMEIVLKDLAQRYRDESGPDERDALRRELVALKRAELSRLTGGELVALVEKSNILNFLIAKHGILLGDKRLPDLKAMVTIRNRATHIASEDFESEKAEAYIMFGNLLRLIAVAEAVPVSPLVEPLVTPRKAWGAETNKLRTGSNEATAGKVQPAEDGLVLFQNKASGKYFLFLGEEASGRILLVTPTGQIKALESALFREGPDVAESFAVSSNYVCAEQVRRYHEYMDTDGRESPIKGPSKRIVSVLPGSSRTKNDGSKAPKTDLVELIKVGLLRNRQKLAFRSGNKELQQYSAVLSGATLTWDGQEYSMSKLAGIALKSIGLSGDAVRGPSFWYTEDGTSVKELWERYLRNSK
jgi:hypothetical protein